MGLNLLNLDHPGVRQAMLDEIALDLETHRLYISERLSPTGAADYPTLLQHAARRGTDGTLAAALGAPGMFKTTCPRRIPSGGYTAVKMPTNAPETLAEGEFNRFYVRGLCRWAGENGIEDLVLYRAKHVTNPRTESEARIGNTVNAHAVLEDLRFSPGTDTALGVPAGPNSGLSLCLPV